ncbi:hypothetical protein AGMMS50239_00690 [Bacteroidia bacterium]|nr:hypothetical protein AGMMS50239_00690 [Bacteroidia bacterium]GHV09302.1 hypothetical protein FACS1894160_4830 [Bacteroidia bacterium]
MVETTERFSDERATGFARSEVAEKLKPVIGLHEIEVKDDRLEFPSVHLSAEVSESELPDETKTTVILYKDITSISPFEARIEVLLQCGELYIFSTMDSVRTHINTYSEGENIKSKKPMTAQDVAENIWNSLDETLSKAKK